MSGIGKCCLPPVTSQAPDIVWYEDHFPSMHSCQGSLVTSFHGGHIGKSLIPYYSRVVGWVSKKIGIRTLVGCRIRNHFMSLLHEFLQLPLHSNNYFWIICTLPKQLKREIVEGISDIFTRQCWRDKTA